MPEEPGDVTRLIPLVRAGDAAAAQELFAALYGELRRIAERVFRSQGPEHTLQPTALVHEAYLKMVRPGAAAPWQDRAHVLAVAARAMRQVLVNHARDRGAIKRGGGVARERVTVDAAPDAGGSAGLDALALDEALERLAALDERQARIAEMRLFGGLSTEEIATLLGVSTRTIETDWRMAKDVLARSLDGPG
jgi:RNA polymerase sigma factor (TIGR02999 family)